ncbi:MULTISPECIES: sporulation membrane protein YtaF [Paenibacillus]|uniref:Sporulation membrane protein YtaF n=1 Tax=Paenibacillus albilobatus TaxID=2716884 RepID=A0A919XE86_9BACL|nr:MULTISPECIES: sporulation membrane protein YtaF [Paenibacillus]GIO30571.1 sporulation membrane protein YtaF [Paenibacillus albilobatus]
MIAPWLSSVSIALASNLDNAGVGAAYGVRNIKIPFYASAVIAFMGFLLTLIGGLSGQVIALWIPPEICNIIGMVILVAIGLWVMLQPFLERKKPKKETPPGLIKEILKNPEAADFNQSKTVDFKESVILGIALSINNLAGGFDAGITNINIWETSIFSGLFSLICIGVCSMAGRKIAGERLGRSASWIAGAILIAIGLHQVI